eukprot:240330-Pelagomonas_calceolata.AAC.11
MEGLQSNTNHQVLVMETKPSAREDRLLTCHVLQTSTSGLCVNHCFTMSVELKLGNLGKNSIQKWNVSLACRKV